MPCISLQFTSKQNLQYMYEKKGIHLELDKQQSSKMSLLHMEERKYTY